MSICGEHIKLLIVCARSNGRLMFINFLLIENLSLLAAAKAHRASD